MSDRLCDCCGKQPVIGVAAVPGMPISIGWCGDCLAANVIPYDLLAVNTALVGGKEHAAEWWLGYIERTLAYFGKTEDEFAEAVAEEMKRVGDLQEEEHP